MSSNCTLIWTTEALERLWEIEEFIARDSAKRATCFIESLIDHTDGILSDNPQSGRIVPETDNPAIRELNFKGYRIVYHLVKNRIVVLSVFEGHRLLRKGDVTSP